MRKSIMVFMAIASLAFSARARADIAEADYPCDGTPPWVYQQDWHVLDAAQSGDGVYVGWEDVTRIVAFYNPGEAPDNPDKIVGTRYNSVGPYYIIPGAYYAYAVLCDGTVVDIHVNGDVYPIPLAKVPNWGFPFVIQQTVEQTNGHAVTQILSASGFLAATIDYDGVSESAVFTSYPNPLQ